MSKESRKNLKDIVIKYHTLYKEYDKAFEVNTLSREDITKKILPIIESGSSEDKEFKDLAKHIYIDNTEQANDVAYYSNKFFITADAYLLTSEEDLPEEITKDYLKLKNQEYTPTFAILKGKFERKKESNQVLSQEAFDLAFEQIKNQIEKDV